MYHVKKYTISTRQEVFGHNTVPNTGWEDDECTTPVSGEFHTVREALDAICAVHGWNSAAVPWQTDAADGTIFAVFRLDADGNMPTDRKTEEWERGERRLYAAEIFVSVVWRDERKLNAEELRTIV